jgi:hypothetical protein
VEYVTLLSVAQTVSKALVVGQIMNGKLFGTKRSWPNRGSTLAFDSRAGGKPCKTSIRIDGIDAEVQNKHLLNTSLE